MVILLLAEQKTKACDTFVTCPVSSQIHFALEKIW
jgi:hypothetical protein